MLQCILESAKDNLMLFSVDASSSDVHQTWQPWLNHTRVCLEMDGNPSYRGLGLLPNELW